MTTGVAALAWRAIWPSWHPGEEAAVRTQCASAPPGVVTLFRRHLPDLETALGTTAWVIDVSDGRTRVAVDEEGGRVRRMPAPFPTFPAAADWLDHGVEPVALGEAAAALGAALGACGFAIDFAPVADLEVAADHPALATRCFGRGPEQAAAYVAAFVRGLQRAGIAGALKHFPGHGAVESDSHERLDVLPLGLDEVRAGAWAPFRAGIGAGAAIVMTAHARWPALDAQRPTTFAPGLIALLRDELAFAGVVVTDDLEMGAVRSDWGTTDAVLMALTAGYDAALLCGHWEPAVLAAEALIHEAERSAALRAHLQAAAARIERLPQVAPPQSFAPALAEAVARRIPWPAAGAA